MLKVAASPVQFKCIFSTFLPRYAERYPNVQVKLIEASWSRHANHAGTRRNTLYLPASRQFRPTIPPLGLSGAANRTSGACHPSFRFGHGSTIDIGRLVSYPLLLPDSGFVVRRTFDAVCSLARLTPDILIESRAPHALLAFAEAGLGVAVIPCRTNSSLTLRIVRITYKGKPLRNRWLSCGISGACFPATQTTFANYLRHICANFSRSRPVCAQGGRRSEDISESVSTQRRCAHQTPRGSNQMNRVNVRVGQDRQNSL